MIVRLLAAAALAGLLVACNEPSGAASQPPDAAAAAETPVAQTDLEADPAILTGRLSNGMRYAVMQNDTPSEAGSLVLAIDVGSLAEEEDQLGLAHFLEHMAFNGSENIPEGEMVPILERHGLAFGADTNAATSFSQTVYTLNLPKADEATLDASFTILRETASRLTLSQDAMDRERGVILSEERSRNTPDYHAQTAQMEFFFPDARFPDRMPIGDVEIVSSAPAERLRDFYEAYYRPERAFLVFVGDVDPQEIVSRIEAEFSDWGATGEPAPDPDPGSVSPREADIMFFHHSGLTLGATIAAVRPAANEPDTSARRHRLLLRKIGNDIVARRLQRLALEPDAAILGGAATATEVEEVADVAILGVAPAPDKFDEGLTLAVQELNRALEYGFTQAELDEQLAQLRTLFQTGAERADTRPSNALANTIVAADQGGVVVTTPQHDLEDFLAFEPQITPEAAHAAFAEQWAGTEPLIFVASGTEIEDAQARILSATQQIQTVDAQAEQAVEDTMAAEFSYTDFGPAGEAAEQSRIDDLGMVQVRFDNNVHLTVKETDFESDTVQVGVRFGGGQQELDPALPGLGAALNDAFLAGGLEAHSADELRTMLAGHNVGMNFGIDEDAFVLSGVTTPADLDLQLQFLAAYMTAPGYRPEGLAQMQRQVEAAYDTIRTTPAGAFGAEAGRILHSGDPRYGLPEKAELLARTTNEMRATMQRALAEGAISIAIVGDVEEQAAIDAVARTFGALPERAAEPAVFKDDHGPFLDAPAETIVLHHEGEPGQALAVVTWPTVDDSDIGTVRRITMMAQVLRGKLIERLREADGATYSPNVSTSFSHAMEDYGLIQVSLDLDVDAVDAAFAAVEEIAASMAAGEVTADELERARRPSVESIETSLESNAYWLQLAVSLPFRPDAADRHRSRHDAYEAMTVEDVAAAAAQFLTPENEIRIAVLPDEPD